MKLYKYGITFDYKNLLCRLTDNLEIDIELRLGVYWHSNYYDGNHRRIGLGIISIYWFY